MTLTIGWDVDGTLGDYDGYFRWFTSDKYQIDPSELKPPSAWNYGTNDGWPFATREEYLQTHHEAVEAGMFRDMDVFDGAVEAMQRARDVGHRNQIVTYRLLLPESNARVGRDTFKWLEKNNFPYDEIAFASDKTSIRVDLLFDDAPAHIQGAVDMGRRVIVPKHRYNEDLVKEHELESFEKWNRVRFDAYDSSMNNIKVIGDRR